MNKMPLVELIEKAAIARGEVKVPRDYITSALEMIDKGEVEVKKYPTGAPSLKGVYDLALKNYREK